MFATTRNVVVQRYIFYLYYPMGYESYYLYIRGEDQDITVNPSTLNGKRIGTISGLLEKSIREWLENNNVNAQINVYDDVHQRDQALKDGKIDAFIGEGASVGSNENLDSKEPYYINDLSKKYFSKNAISLQVAADEKKWLEAHDYTINVGYMDNFLPVS